MTENTHTTECRKANARWSNVRDEYAARWPNHCQTCGGWGGSSSPGCSVPYGSTYVSLPDDVDICPDCQEQGMCPRCGSGMDVEAEAPCPACGWSWGDEGIPEPPGCVCPSLYDPDI